MCRYFIAQIEKARLDQPISWLHHLAKAYNAPFSANNSMSGPDTRSRYITALYFTLTTITSIGFGNVAAYTNYEKLFAICAMMCGCEYYLLLLVYCLLPGLRPVSVVYGNHGNVCAALITAAIFGNVSSIMLRLYSGAEEYQEMQSSIKEFIRFHHIPKQLATRLSESYHTAWSYTNGVDMNSVSSQSVFRIGVK